MNAGAGDVNNLKAKTCKATTPLNIAAEISEKLIPDHAHLRNACDRRCGSQVAIAVASVAAFAGASVIRPPAGLSLLLLLTLEYSVSLFFYLLLFSLAHAHTAPPQASPPASSFGLTVVAIDGERL